MSGDGSEIAGVTADSLASLVRVQLDKFTPTERRVCHVLLSNYPFAGLETAAELAARAGVSAPTVLRFVARLGLSGYPEFQKRLREELEARLIAPAAKHRPADEATGAAAALDAFAAAVKGNVTRTMDDVAVSEFEAIATLLADPKRPIHCVGGRFTEPLALYLVRHLRIVRPDVTMLDAMTATWGDHVINMDKRDVLVAFDIRRYQTDVIQLAENAAARGASVVLFTDTWLSPIVRIARHVLSSQVGVPSNFDSTVAMLALIEALIARVTDDLWPTAKLRMEALEKLRGA
ncbi:MAG: MurR/RpiR family transcriptional regulator [Hyphomicrobiaceae bacterium]|nr:MurR/RpiR family transcriptional regulator [Hyphomicrobiaceae bacterium]